MKAFLCTWLSLIFLSIGIMARDKGIGIALIVIAVALIWNI